MHKLLASTLMVPLILIAIGGLGYAMWTDNVTKTISATAGTVDIRVWYAWRKYGPTVTVTWTTETASFTWPDPLYPGWEAGMGMHIKNIGSLPVRIDAVVYTSTNPPLFACFTIKSDFASSPDYNTWTPTTLPVTLAPGAYLDVQEYLHFDCQEHPELMGQTITITATITAVQAC